MIVLCGAIEQGADALLGHLDGSFYGLVQRRFEFGSGCASGHAASSRQAARRAQRPWVRAIFVLAQVSSMKARRHPPRWCLHRPGVFVGSRNGPARLHPGFFAVQPGHHEATGSGSGVPGHADWENLSVNSSGR